MSDEELINNKIFEFCCLLTPNEWTIQDKSIPTLKQAHVTDITYDIESNTFIVTLCEPGVLIGTAGVLIKKLETLLGSKIKLIEKKFYKTNLL
jgi:transcription antitermination factor NusA-like protein